MKAMFAIQPKGKRGAPSPIRTHPARKPAANRAAGVGTGMPLFLQRAPAPSAGRGPRAQAQPVPDHPGSVHEQEANGVADATVDPGQVQPEIIPGTANQSSALGRAVAQRARLSRGEGRPLPAETRRTMERQLGTDLGDVRLHTDAGAQQWARSLGANAFTMGRDVYFGESKFDPGSREGERLLAHELTHVVQQGGEASGQVQFDLIQSLPTALGGFEIEMATRSTPSVGMEGHIRFLPDPTGPYSARIGLIQAANVTDVGGTTTTPGSPVDWSNVGTGGEWGRSELMTTGMEQAPKGWFVDFLTAVDPRGSSVEPTYVQPSDDPTHNYHGWLRSPTDVHAASLYDYPNFNIDTDFDFETVAKAADTQTVYGSLEWGFQIRSGAVQTEYANAYDAESTAFNEALERFRGYYAHEPIVIYFDTNKHEPLPGEGTKLLGALDYLNRYPDVMVEITGYADERGRPGYNADLSLRRALSVESLLTTLGVDASRIDTPIGMGETAQFSPGGGQDTGSWRANRRVVVSFRRTQSTPIVVP